VMELLRVLDDHCGPQATRRPSSSAF
jgi:hypothetical protein